MLLFLLCGAIGFTGGFYIAVALQKQIQVLIGAAIVLAVLTWIGSGADLLGLLREWYKDKREEERVPKLGFDEFFKIDSQEAGATGELNATRYFVKIINTNSRSEGIAGICQGFVILRNKNIQLFGNMDMQDSPSVRKQC